jgi:excisionase family DNA binding protein
LISSREAAKRLGVSQATVLRAAARGTLKPVTTTPGGHHRFRLEDVDAVAGAPSRALTTTLISTSAAARLLGVSQHTVIRACRDGRLESDETTPGGHHRFSEQRIRELSPLAGELVGTGVAARALGLTIDKLRRAVQRGAVIPATVTPGGHRRFAVTELTTKGLQSDGNGSRHGKGDGGRHVAA